MAEDIVIAALEGLLETSGLNEDEIEEEDELLIDNARAVLDKLKGLETPRMLVLSTSHITQSTAELLDAKVHDRMTPAARTILPIVYEKGEYGWLLPLIGEDEDRGCWARYRDLVAIRTLAEAAGCTWIMLDRDGDTVEGLPTYDW